MRRMPVIAGAALILGALGLAALGSARYGGPGGLLLRVRAEFNVRQPRSGYVPTPLPTATGGAVPTRVPTATAEPTPPATVATPAVRPSETPAPATPMLALTLLPAATATVVSAAAEATPATVQLTGLTHAWQTWNNCGPATLSMCLSYYGDGITQEDIRLVVRPNPEDKHAGPEELAEVARARGLEATVRVNGTPEQVRRLVAAGIPVMVSTWHEDTPGDGMGHYRLVVGYDDDQGEWLLYDSLAATAADRDAPYEPLRLAYEEFQFMWAVFNNRYIVIYPERQDSTVQAILGEQLDDAIMWQQALTSAQGALAEDDADAFRWFNLGSDLLALGRYEEAASAYDRARQLGLPWRMLWYQFGPFPAYYNVGRYDEVIALADATLEMTTDVEELHYWRGMALAAQGRVPEARAALERAAALRAGYDEALEALGRLP